MASKAKLFRYRGNDEQKLSLSKFPVLYTNAILQCLLPQDRSKLWLLFVSIDNEMLKATT